MVEEKTIQQFIVEHSITMTADPISARTDRGSKVDPKEEKWDKEAAHFMCTIKAANGRAFTIPYSVGCGIVFRFVLEQREKGKRIPDLMASSQEITRALNKYMNITLFDEKIREAALKWGRANYKPDLESVLDCLASDYCGFINARDFDDWCSEYGYDTDSRKAEKIYNTVREQSRALESLLGRAACEDLAFNVERL